MTARRVVIGLVAVAAVLLVAGRFGASLYTDYLWYNALGAPEVWRAKLMSTIAITAASFLAATLFAFINLFAVRRSVVSLVLPRRIGNIEIGEEVPGHYLLLAALGLSALIGGILTLPPDLWDTALLARIGRPFSERDPYFSADLGFFVYWLPFEGSLHLWAILVLVTVTVTVILLYALTPSLKVERGSLYVSAYVRRHFTMLGAVLLLVLSWSYRLSMYRLLSFGGGANGVFSMIDDKVFVPAALFLAAMTLAAALVVAWAGWTGQMRLAFAAVSAVLVMSLVSRTIAPFIYSRSMDEAERRRGELAYVATRLAYTRVAYGVDRMRPEPVGSGFQDVSRVASRVALWDPAMLVRSEGRAHRAHVVGGGPGWQATPDGIMATLVERGSELSDGRDAWSISQLDPSSNDARGLPARPSAQAFSQDALPIAEPAVYDSAPGYSVLSDSLRQLYGVEMVSTRSRFVHAWSLQNFRLFLGTLPPNRPVMIERRDVRERVEMLAPYFVQGSEVRPVVSQDSLYWVLELYSASSTYPLSLRLTVLGNEESYFAHAATAIVHAASGRVQLVLAQNADPIASSWAKCFPRLFSSSASLPPALANALPPIVDGVHAQASAFAAAGFRGDSLETRHFPASELDTALMREPIRASLSATSGVSAMWPLLDSTERVRGVVSGSGGANRITSWIPIVGVAQRWGVVQQRMRAADSVTRESGIQYGALRVLPLRGQPLYVQPTFYMKPGAPPLLARVAVLRDDTVHTAATLAEALGKSSSARSGDTNVVAPSQIRPDSLYVTMRQALARGDWAGFGKALEALGAALHVRPR